MDLWNQRYLSKITKNNVPVYPRGTGATINVPDILKLNHFLAPQKKRQLQQYVPMYKTHPFKDRTDEEIIANVQLSGQQRILYPFQGNQLLDIFPPDPYRVNITGNPSKFGGMVHPIAHRNTGAIDLESSDFANWKEGVDMSLADGEVGNAAYLSRALHAPPKDGLDRMLAREGGLPNEGALQFYDDKRARFSNRRQIVASDNQGRRQFLNLPEYPNSVDMLRARAAMAEGRGREVLDHQHEEDNYNAPQNPGARRALEDPDLQAILHRDAGQMHPVDPHAPLPGPAPDPLENSAHREFLQLLEGIYHHHSMDELEGKDEFHYSEYADDLAQHDIMQRLMQRIATADNDVQTALSSKQYTINDMFEVDLIYEDYKLKVAEYYDEINNELMEGLNDHRFRYVVGQFVSKSLKEKLKDIDGRKMATRDKLPNADSFNQIHREQMNGTGHVNPFVDVKRTRYALGSDHSTSVDGEGESNDDFLAIPISSVREIVSSSIKKKNRPIITPKQRTEGDDFSDWRSTSFGENNDTDLNESNLNNTDDHYIWGNTPDTSAGPSYRSMTRISNQQLESNKSTPSTLTPGSVRSSRTIKTTPSGELPERSSFSYSPEIVWENGRWKKRTPPNHKKRYFLREGKPSIFYDPRTVPKQKKKSKP